MVFFLNNLFQVIWCSGVVLTHVDDAWCLHGNKIRPRFFGFIQCYALGVLGVVFFGFK